MELVGSKMQCHPPVVVRSGVYATDKAILPGEDDLMKSNQVVRDHHRDLQICPGDTPCGLRRIAGLGSSPGIGLGPFD